MCSIAALRAGGGSYTAAKAAIIGWTYDLAKSLGKEGITVNLVAHGYVTRTEFFGNAMTPERNQRLVSETMDGKRGHLMTWRQRSNFLLLNRLTHHGPNNAGQRRGSLR
jgi:NAD(P)-dependent dehydrogenase (short-subunit alcohol dehydrogenase family)